MLKILFIGDVVSRLGRATIAKVLPEVKSRAKIDLCFANGENLAGGRGLSRKTALEVIGCGVDYLTGGDHTFWLEAFQKEIGTLPVLRPLNLPGDFPGSGFVELTVGKTQVVLVSLLGAGSSLIRQEAENPFRAVDRFLQDFRIGRNSVILVDFHAETSSEKVALGWYLDGRVSAVLGTHTHVPTADGWILPSGTAYVTDVGMVGPRSSVLGVEKSIIISRFKDGDRAPFTWVKSGAAVFNSVLVCFDKKSGKALSIERIDRVVEG